MSNQQAQAALEKFLDRKLTGMVTFDGPQLGADGWFVHLMEPGGVLAMVDVQTGRVISVVFETPAKTTVKLTKAQAQAAAAAWLTAHGIPFGGMDVTVELREQAQGLPMYRVTYQRHVNGATVPDMREVQLDAGTGEVYSFLDGRGSYGAVPSPVIDKDAAVAKAKAAAGLETPTLVKVELMMAPWPDQTDERLVWSVQLDTDVHGYIDAAWLYVDAITGETIVVGRG